MNFSKDVLRVGIILLMAAVFISGCSKQFLMQDDEGNILGAPRQKYTVLSFFFDGVPDPDKPLQSGQTGTGSGNGSGKSRLTRTTYREHGPFAAKMCDGCHERSTNVLIMPIEKLCLNCHTLQLDKKYVHGPLVSGGCKVCHDPHGSAFPFLLVSEPLNFCFYCHDKKDVARNEVHEGVTEACTVCHNAHMSDNNHLLK